MNDKYILESPNGIRIRGTLETIEARKGIRRIKPHPETGFTYEEDYERTELFWDSQKTVTTPTGETLFLDEDGNTWPASKHTDRHINGGDNKFALNQCPDSYSSFVLLVKLPQGAALNSCRKKPAPNHLHRIYL